MTQKAILRAIKSTVKSFLPDSRIVLFGSRARGDFNADSDFDVLIIVPQSFATAEKKERRIKIKQALVDALDLPMDILINSEKEVETKKDLPGHTIRWALKEGVVL